MPIVQVMGDLIRQVPGTISLGQGVVHYGPPASAMDAVRSSLAQPATHEYQDGVGLAPLVERLTAKLRDENGIDLERGSRVMVTAGANMAFMHAVFAITDPGERHVAVADKGERVQRRVTRALARRQHRRVNEAGIQLDTHVVECPSKRGRGAGGDALPEGDVAGRQIPVRVREPQRYIGSANLGELLTRRHDPADERV